MSSRTKRVKAAGKKKDAPVEAPKTETPKETKPAGRVPEASVSARHGFSMTERRGKGFSRRELGEGGLPLGLALRWRVPVDLRRRSMIEANVSAIKKWYVQPKGPERTAAPKKTQGVPHKRTPKKKEG